jgi:hypothetical protein
MRSGSREEKERALTIGEAKARLRIPELWQRFDLPGQPKRSCKSPFREDRRASFSVSQDGFLFNDFATGESGDAVDFLQLLTGLSRPAAYRKFIDLAAGEMAMTKSLPRSTEVSRRRERPKFPEFEKGGAVDFKHLAGLRNLGIESLQLASERGLLWFAELRGFDAWIVSDSERVNAQARRMDGGIWEHLDGAKGWTLRGSWASWPIGAKEAQPFKSLALCEGGPDLCAACHFIWCEKRERDVAPVALLGASQRIHEDALPLLAGKRIRIFPHLDNAGQQAAERWARQLADADVDALSFAGLHKTSGEPVNDLNDCTSVDPDDFEVSRELWGVMP